MERPLCCSPYHSYHCQGRRDWTLGSLQSREASHSGRTGKSASRIEGKSSPVKSFETETRSTGGLLILLLMAALIDLGVTSHNPHRPAKITWKLSDGQTHEQLSETSGIHPPNTWWPDLYFDLRRLFGAGAGWDSSGRHNYQVTSRRKRALINTARGWSTDGFWACPGNLRNNWKTCGGMESYYCRSWSWVTSCDGPQQWDVENRDLVKFTFQNPQGQPPPDQAH